MKTTVLTTFVALAILAVGISLGVHAALSGFNHIVVVGSR